VNVINFSRTLLDNTKGGVVAGFGVALLFWTIIKVLGNIEHSFNDIWGIKKMRPWGRRFSDYLSVVLICPVLFILASGITVFAKTQAILITEKIAILGAIAPLITLLVDLLPFTVVWVLFTFIYIFMPNTKVNIKSALLAGVVAGTIYQLTQWVYVDFQVGVAKANAIYGSFAALPLFLVWLQLSWRIVLLGAEVSFAHQNVDTYEFEPDCLNVSHSFKQLLSLRVVNLLAKNFSEGKAALSAAQISHELEIPIRLVRDIIFELTESGIVSTITQEKAPVYQPALDVNLLTIRYVIGKLNSRGSDNIPVVESREIKRIAESLKKFAELVSGSPENLCLKEI
ncbi:MAG: YihY/virulence factor BrkB family protein, partial [Candidatus Omnitrophica bacterium]|nr:YihY/virulence factor BrkB family protein [Candidatus Omnitrophota bacterium]